jgi:hypothetical protein
MLKNNQIHSYIINDITGHSQNTHNMDEAIYGDKQMPEQIIHKIINECLVYDFLDFSKIEDAIKKLY